MRPGGDKVVPSLADSLSREAEGKVEVLEARQNSTDETAIKST
jgi:hypothetical protein